MKQDKKQELFQEGLTTSQLLDKLEVEKNDEFWGGYWKELRERSPFADLYDLIDDIGTQIDKLEKMHKKLESLLRTHKHMDGKTVAEI